MQLGSWFVVRTECRVEDKYEIALPAPDAVALWRYLVLQDVAPAGLVARDALRLEAGMSLSGVDVDENSIPKIGTVVDSGLRAQRSRFYWPASFGIGR